MRRAIIHVILSCVVATGVRAEEPVTLHGSSDPLPERVIVLVHGLDEPGTIWRALIPALVADGHAVAEIHYANDQAVARSADAVAAVLGDLARRGVRRVDLIAHSMGGLVCRALIADDARYADAGAARAGLPAIDRLIMVATPNHGSELARLRALGEAREQVVRLFTGRAELGGGWLDGDGAAAADLLPGSDLLRALAAEPAPRDVRVTIIAGDASPLDARALADAVDWWRDWVDDDAAAQAWREGLAALSDGTGDGAVSVESTRLDHVADHVVLHGNHLSLLEPLLPGDEPPAIDPIRSRLRE
ncbi:MAG TPA: alpha/beta fold hydrolase [Planctomycetota bacterium]|nr:alpha/beta fold hydrolase [Planctomycetota bacterium]